VTLGGAGALVVGAGALGSPVATYLTSAGVGRIGIVDPLAAEAAAAQLGALNPDVLLEPYPASIDAGNARAMVAGQDVVVDCSNMQSTHDALTAACGAEGVPLVVGGGAGLDGWITSSCARCAAVPEGGEMDASVAGMVGSAQALEAIKLLSGTGVPLLDRVVWLDGAAFRWREEPVTRDPGCPACGTAPQSV
jgi:molybdopterin/thiamine biosynthesis adenylyltransferase